jgi:hypothetical protein
MPGTRRREDWLISLVEAFRAPAPCAACASGRLGGTSSGEPELGTAVRSAVHLHSTVRKKWGRGETQFIGGGVLVDRGIRIDQVRNY